MANEQQIDNLVFLIDGYVEKRWSSLKRKRPTTLLDAQARDGISDTFTVIPDALGKDCEVFTGDLDADELGIDIDELIKLQQS